jgi:ribonucleoside-diphosphate reductase alpha chain
MSLALRAGIDPQEIVNQLKGISGPSPVWEGGELILSTPDAIGRALERYVLRRQAGGGVAQIPEYAEDAARTPPAQVSDSGATMLVTCPECGSSVAHEGSCLTCKHCGWSKC